MIYTALAAVMTSLYFFDTFYTDNTLLTGTVMPVVLGPLGVLKMVTADADGEEFDPDLSAGETLQQEQSIALV